MVDKCISATILSQNCLCHINAFLRYFMSWSHSKRGQISVWKKD